ncbi:MAG: NADH/ubiquinone/plastoquinone (complex I) [Candidatus Omnitrophica bacterium]|nr:NADH/ubiquinone/plastoquinone (complex I) [Candidatus Omnitrophota bacterium]
MVLDGLTSFMLITVNLVTFLVAIYSISYMEKYTDKWKFWTLFMLMLAGMNGVIITGDMFNLFVFLEISAISSYALVAFGTEAEELEASFKYAIMGSVASSFILLGVAILYSHTSTLNMADMANVLSEKSSDLLKFVSVLFLMGFGLKAALVPFHAWLPDAHPSAPASISAMLSGIFIKVLGIYALSRIVFNVFGLTPLISSIFITLGILSMILGGFLAFGQIDIKRLYAYSSISQIGYITLSLGLGTPQGVMAGLFHLFNHSLFKSLLFLNSGAIESVTQTRDLRRMGGLMQKAPLISYTNIIGAMSISGIPPLNGFFSKLLIVLACIQAKRLDLATAAILVSILTLIYYLKATGMAFFGTAKTQNSAKKLSFSMNFSLVILSILCLIGGLILIPNVSDIFLKKAVNALLNGKNYANLVFEALK